MRCQSQLRLLPILVICLAGLVACDYKVIYSLGSCPALGTTFCDKIPLVQGSSQASFYDEEDGDPGVIPDNSGDIINNINGGLGGNGTACCPVVVTDDNGNVNLVVNVNGDTGGAGQGGNLTIVVGGTNITAVKNVTGVVETKSHDNTVIVIALAVSLGSCAILAAAALYYYFKHHKKDGSTVSSSKFADAMPRPAKAAVSGGTGEEVDVVLMESESMEMQDTSGRPIAHKVAQYRWNAAANAVADPKPGGHVVE